MGPTRTRWFSDLDCDLVAGSSGVSGPGVVTEHFVGTAGHLQFDIGGPAGSYEVTCFEVSGNTATIGFHRTEDQISLQSFAQLVDGGALGSGLDTVAGHINELPGAEQRDPSDCSSPVEGDPSRSKRARSSSTRRRPGPPRRPPPPAPRPGR